MWLPGLVLPLRTYGEFENLATLRAAGFPAVEPVACGRSGVWIRPRRAFLITREVTGAKNLRDWSREGGLEIEPRDVASALMALARALARLHRRGIYVGTLYAKNILVRRAAPGGVELVVCDVPGLLVRPGRLRLGLAVRDLACLERWACRVHSPRARWAFLRRYLDEMGEGPPARWWARRIVARRERMLHRTPAGRASQRFRRAMQRIGLGVWWPF